MINIRYKTAAELEEEKSLYDFAARVAKGIPKPVCPTYLVKRDGTRVNTYDLTEQQILGLIEIDLVDYTSPRGTYNRDNRTDLDAIRLVQEIKGHYIPSVAATLKLCQLEQQYGHILRDLMGSFGSIKYFDNAKTIAEFNKECNGDFSQVTQEEIIAILEQMQNNELARKNEAANVRTK